MRHDDVGSEFFDDFPTSSFSDEAMESPLLCDMTDAKSYSTGYIVQLVLYLYLYKATEQNLKGVTNLTKIVKLPIYNKRREGPF